jgi:hypothetical protein
MGGAAVFGDNSASAVVELCAGVAVISAQQVRLQA